ncbi:hypothetical protein D3C80_2134530 [compost metagenome]
MDERRQETQAGEQHRQQRGVAGMAGIRQATGDGCSDGANGTDQGEQGDFSLGQAMVA